MRLRWRIALAFVLTTAILAGIVALVSALMLRGLFLERLEDDMARQAQQYAAVLEVTGEPAGAAQALQSLTQAAGMAGELRFTLIASDGRVLADSEADPANMENHAGRPEVAQALAGREGRAHRESTTLRQQEVYVAIPLRPGVHPWSEGALRAALPAARVDAMVAASWQIPVVVWAILLVPTLLVAYLLSRSLTRPVGRLVEMAGRVAAGDLSSRTAIHRRDELGRLGEELNVMTEQLQRRALELTHELERSRGVLRAMSEGVLLVDAAGHLIRSNPAAANILDAALEGQEGAPLVHLARAFPLSVSPRAPARPAGRSPIASTSPMAARSPSRPSLWVRPSERRARYFS